MAEPPSGYQGGSILPQPSVPVEMKVFQGGGSVDLLAQPDVPVPMRVFQGGGQVVSWDQLKDLTFRKKTLEQILSNKALKSNVSVLHILQTNDAPLTTHVDQMKAYNVVTEDKKKVIRVIPVLPYSQNIEALYTGTPTTLWYSSNEENEKLDTYYTGEKGTYDSVKEILSRCKRGPYVIVLKQKRPVKKGMTLFKELPDSITTLDASKFVYKCEEKASAEKEPSVLATETKKPLVINLRRPPFLLPPILVPPVNLPPLSLEDYMKDLGRYRNPIQQFFPVTIKLTNDLRVRYIPPLPSDANEPPSPEYTQIKDDIVNYRFKFDEAVLFDELFGKYGDFIRWYINEDPDNRTARQDEFFLFWKNFVNIDGIDNFQLRLTKEGLAAQNYLRKTIPHAYLNYLTGKALPFLLKYGNRSVYKEFYEPVPLDGSITTVEEVQGPPPEDKVAEEKHEKVKEEEEIDILAKKVQTLAEKQIRKEEAEKDIKVKKKQELKELEKEVVKKKTKTKTKKNVEVPKEAEAEIPKEAEAELPKEAEVPKEAEAEAEAKNPKEKTSDVKEETSVKAESIP